MTIKVSTDQSPIVAREGAAAIASARRAALADRYAADSLIVEWLDLAQLDSIADAWHALAARALEPNVFYEPSFTLAAAPVFGTGAGALLVWSGVHPRKLLGFFPARIETRRYGFRLPVLVGFTHAYGPLGVPLAEREAAGPVIAAVLGRLAADPSLPGLLLLPFLRMDGPFAAALDTILRQAQLPAADFNRRSRALLKPDREREDYLANALSSHKHKELRRLSRRLADKGALLFAVATEPAAVAAALTDFLALEADGWKGRAGTAAAHDDDLCRFVRSGAAALAAENKIAIHRVLLDGRAVAAAIVLRSGRSVWFWKIAHDEALAHFSPGVMLTAAITEELVADETIAECDSCAAEDHPMIGRIWRERLTLAERLIAVRPQVPFSHVRRLEALRAAAIATAKNVRDYLRR